MIIDTHTHILKEAAGVSVLNFYPYDDLPKVEMPNLLSCGIHPWFIQENKLDIWLRNIEHYCQKKTIIAIGECGLDKNIENIQLQKEVFKRQISLSEQYGLPMIIHSVKMYHMVLEIRKITQAKQPWIIHGYQGSIETANQFVKQNIFISFGESLLKKSDKLKSVLNQIDIDFLLFETDDSNISIKAIYKHAAKLLGLDEGLLEKKIESNFYSVFS